MLYYIDNIDGINTDAFLPYLSDERLAYQNRYRFEIDRKQSILAYILLRVGLMEEYGITTLPKLGKTERGKPHLIDHSEIYFNLSHCKKGIACAISDQEVGVDIQDYVPFDEGIAKQFMTPQEIGLAKSDPTDREFTRIWTLKESWGKRNGMGICYELTSTPAIEGLLTDGAISKCTMLRDFAISVTASAEMKIIKLSAADLLKKCQRLAV